MAQGEFLWCDLATFSVEETLKYYRDLFEWELKPEEFPDGSTYTQIIKNGAGWLLLERALYA